MINYNHLIFANLPRYRFKNNNILYKIIVQSYYNETESKSEQLNKNISETMKTTRKLYSNTNLFSVQTSLKKLASWIQWEFPI